MEADSCQATPVLSPLWDKAEMGSRDERPGEVEGGLEGEGEGQAKLPPVPRTHCVGLKAGM